MKKYLISLAVIVIFAGYLWFQNQSSSQTVDITPAPHDPGTLNPDTGNLGTTPTSTPVSGTPTATPATTQASGFKNGTFTSSVFDATYGPLQLTVTVSGGQITNITWPQYPTDSGHTREVSNSALPILKTEAIAAQSANVDVVSGATQTSEAFIQALASVLKKA